MSTWFPALAVASLLIAAPLTADDAANLPRESVAWALTYGVLPPDLGGDTTRPGDQPHRESLSGYVDVLRQELAQDHDAALAVARRAWADTFGPNRPFEAREQAGPTALTYIELSEVHLAWLGTNPEGWRSMIDDAYRTVLGRAAYDVEHDYWLNRQPVPYFLVAACIDNWARRNQPGLMATSGTPCVPYNSPWLQSLRLDRGVADEVRAFLAPGASVDELAVARGHTVVAPGAVGLVSVGGISFVAVGR